MQTRAEEKQKSYKHFLDQAVVIKDWSFVQVYYEDMKLETTIIKNKEWDT